mgnify:FL=1|tara:strand:- start:134 stop:538 length:405 start_codon:yes stop_codon:yes gene_type:complete
MKISKNRLKAIIMQEVKNIMETKKGKDKETGRPDDEAYVADAGQDEVEDGHRTGKKAFTTKRGMKKKTGPGDAYTKKPKNRKDSVKEDYDYTEEKHDDEDEDHLERIRDDINRHIDALRDQHRRVKDYEDRKDD